MKFRQYLTEQIKAGDVFKIKGKTYPTYVINSIDKNMVNYTIHTASGSTQQSLNINMFKRIKNLQKS